MLSAVALFLLTAAALLSCCCSLFDERVAGACVVWFAVLTEQTALQISARQHAVHVLHCTSFV